MKNRLFLIVSLFFVLNMPQAWCAMNLPTECKGFLNSSITNMESMGKTPSEAQANAWRRCNAIQSANRAAKIKAIKAKRQAWANSQS